jgi:hypothetical protein
MVLLYYYFVAPDDLRGSSKGAVKLPADPFSWDHGSVFIFLRALPLPPFRSHQHLVPQLCELIVDMACSAPASPDNAQLAHRAACIGEALAPVHADTLSTAVVGLPL